jgi:Sec-independent protein translocase protein TatA
MPEMNGLGFMKLLLILVTKYLLFKPQKLPILGFSMLLQSARKVDLPF